MRERERERERERRTLMRVALEQAELSTTTLEEKGRRVKGGRKRREMQERRKAEGEGRTWGGSCAIRASHIHRIQTPWKLHSRRGRARKKMKKKMKMKEMKKR